ncbi:tetratricopeptide repeat protein [Treponema bryantii]|uniref:tetratricopeptide repeat protein n=1 Tax=Treponema bryantii TaxID=163 RepID=UPI0003B72C63|nr:tetratricopeptide repeat protein [Treponema bryantii]
MANSLILTKAQNAITAHDWATAARYYKELLRNDESNAEYLKELGSIYVRAGEDEKAIPYYEQIITFKPENTDAMVSLGAIFRRLKRYEDSVNILHKAQDISSANPNINYNLGFTYKEMGDYDDAIDSFESVISRNPDDVLAHNHLGSIYFAKKEYDKAIAAYKKGLQVDQNHPILNYNLAHVYENMKNYPEAVRCYEVALKTRPGWLDAIRDFSELLIKCQETKQAQELVEQSIKLHPDDVEMLCILGRIYLNQFDYDNATKTFKRAEDLKQNDIEILVGLSKSLEKGMKIDQAMDKILDAVDIAPENLDVCKQYAHVLLSAQRYEKALDLIKTIDEKSDGKDVQILDLYGQYFVCRGDEEAANTYYDKIRKLNHHYKDYMINAADRYIQTGNYEKAEEMADNFVASRPHLPEGYNLLGTINSARGELNKAKASYEKGIGLKNPNVFAVKALEKINSELEANKEIYNDSESPIEVDADKLTEEEGGNIADDTSFIASDEETADQLDALNANGDSEAEEKNDSALHGLETTPPIEQALAGEEGDFWEDFDDDPNAEAKPITEEDDSYDENEENPDLMSMMTPDAAEDDNSLENGLSEDEGGFDFSDFEDAPAAGSDVDAATAAPDEEPAVSAPAESEISPAAKPEAETAAEPQPYQEQETLSQAQKLMDDLKQQQKEMEDQKKEMEQQQKDFELQQREFALQQKELADELKQKNEEMIQEAVGKAVDEAVEEKLSGYDLQPAQEAVVEPEVEESAEEEPVAETPSEEVPAEDVTAEEAPSEEIPSDDFDLQLYDEDFGDTDFADENDISSSESEDILAEEAALDGLDSDDFAESEEAAETEVEPEQEPESEPETEEEVQTEAESEDEEEPMNDDMLVGISAQEFEELTSDPFVTVDDIYSLTGSESPEAEEAAVEKSLVETAAENEDLSDDNFVTADDMVDKIGRILNDDKTAKDYAAELELFKKLRTLSSFLPEKDKNSYDCCRMRMVIEYIIQKMSGKPGLLLTAESLIKSGVLGEEYNRQLEDCCEEELSNDLIRHVISDMKKLAEGLEDKFLCKALCVSADAILEQIALIDQQVAIF